ncbi:MAG: autotransporter assembly complex protein TamB, partial [Enterobacteriaceae bacterium]
PGLTLSLQQVSLSVNARCMLHSRLCINQLSGKGIEVSVVSAELPGAGQEAKKPSEPLQELALPYPVQLDRLVVDDLALDIDGTHIALQHFGSGFEWQQRTLSLAATQIKQLQVSLAAPAKQKQPPVPETLSLQQRLQPLFAEPLLAQVADIVLPLDIQLPDLRAQQLSFIQPDAAPLQITELALSGSTEQSRIRVDKLDVRSEQGKANLQGEVDLSQAWPVALKLSATLAQAPLAGETLSLDIKGAAKQQVQVQMQLKGQAQAVLQAQLDTGTAGLPFALSWQSKQLQWPLTGESEYKLSDSQIKLTGKATDYQLVLSSHLAGREIPAATLSVKGRGNLTRFIFEPLKVATLQGESLLNGQVDWGEGLAWKGKLSLSGVNGKKQWPQWPFTLQGHIATEGHWRDGEWQLRIPEMALQGTVAQGPLQLKGALAGDSTGHWQVDDVRVQMGKNHLRADGTLREQWKLDLQLDAPQLQGTLPGLAGSVQGQIKLRGQLSEPELNMQLTADKLRWQQLQINSAKVDALLHSRKQLQGKATVELQGMTQPGLELDNVALTLQGDESRHQLALTLKGKPVAGEVRLQGQFDRQKQSWRGVLSDSRFSTPVGEWSLQNRVSLEYIQARQQLTISSHCWLNANAQVCLPVTAKIGAQGEAKVQLRQLDLALIKPWLPPATQLQGVITGDATASWHGTEGLPTVNISLQGQGVKIAQQVQKGSTVPVAFEALTLDIGITPQQARLNWLFNIAGNGQFTGQVRIREPQGRRTLSGEITLDSLSLAALQPLFQPDEKIQGIVQGDLQLGGTVRKPGLTGAVNLQQLLLEGRFMPFSMQPSTLNIRFDGNRSQLEGQLLTTQGQLTLSGDSNWSNPAAWHAQLAAKGERIRIVVPPMIRLDASPDLLFSASPDNLQLSGEIAIPWARLTVQTLPEQAVSVSDDQVMLNDQRQPVEQKSLPIPFSSQLKVSLGSDVRLDAFGLKSKLGGQLIVNQGQTGLGLNGQVVLEGGRFHAYGQDLLIRRGNLLFSGAAQQPMLDIEAIRNPQATQDDVVAGVRVSGLAGSPKVDIFSDPAMSQQEALSYLVRGQGLHAESDQSDMMTSMLIGLGVAKSGNLVGQIGKTFGISNLSLDTEGVGDKSQVVVSGYVLPGLQVKYGVGLFDSLATLTLRYRLMPKLYLQALSGADLALDLLYQFEF